MYISTEIKDLSNGLHTSVVEFEYKKKDGTIRKAKGTLLKEKLPNVQKEEIKFEKETIDLLLKLKNISFEEYTKSNGIILVKTETINTKEYYVFNLVSKRKENNDMITYFDIEKNEFRSFSKENFLGIISIEN